MTSTDLYNIIKLALAKKIPTSVCRMGDGEAIVLNGFNDSPKLEWVLKRQLGYMLEESQVAIIQKNLITAYKDANYIGVPENKREGLNEYWYKCLEILESNIGTLENKNLCSVDFHNHWLTDGFFDELLTGRDTLIYISCRDLDEGFRTKYGIKNIHSFRIAPEMKFTPGYKGLAHYPTQYEQVKEWIEAVPIEGNLCLVGAGVVGKIYNTWFKERGGISLDIGNVFDAFAGLVTRGKDRGVGVIDNTYKL